MKPYKRLRLSTYASIMCFLLGGLGETIAFTQHAQVRVQNPRITRINVTIPTHPPVHVPRINLPNINRNLGIHNKSLKNLNQMVIDDLRLTFDNAPETRSKVFEARRSKAEKFLSIYPNSKPDESKATHLVKRGDTISGIAKESYGTGEPSLIFNLARNNLLANPDIVVSGQPLLLPQNLPDHILVFPEEICQIAFTSQFQNSKEPNKTDRQWKQDAKVAAEIFAQNFDARRVNTFSIQGDKIAVRTFFDDGRSHFEVSTKRSLLEQLSQDPTFAKATRAIEKIATGGFGIVTGDDFEHLIATNETPSTLAPAIPSNRLSAEVAFIGRALDEGRTDTEIRNSLLANPRIYAFGRMLNNGIFILEKDATGDKYTLYVRDNSWGTLEIASLTEFDNFVRDNIIKPASTADLPFLHAAIEGKDVVFQWGSMTKRISREEIIRLLENPNIPRSPLDELIAPSTAQKIVVYPDPLYRLRKDIAPDPEDLAVMLNIRYSDRIFYVGNEPELAIANIESNRPVKGAKDLALIVPAPSDEIIDYGLAKDLIGQFRDWGADIIPMNGKGVVEYHSFILFIAGHMDENLMNFLEKLGSMGMLKHCTLYVGTCEREINKEFFRYLIEKYNPTIIRHKTKIGRAVFPVFFHKMRETFQEIETSNESVLPYQLWRRAINRALEDSNLSPELHQLFEDFRKAFPQVSNLQFETPQDETAMEQSYV